MFCGHCGTKMEKVERFCTECGKEQLQESPAVSWPLPVPEVNQGTHAATIPEMNQGTHSATAPELNQGTQPTTAPELNQGTNHKKTVGIIAAICAVLVLLIGAGLFLIFGASGDVEVPDLSHLPKDEAILLIEESRLTVGEITEEYSGRVEAGLVISQSPRAGSEVERGTTIDLTISLGVELVEVPDVTGLDLTEATVLIREMGLALDVVDDEYSDTIDEGVVISQSIPAGTQVEIGESIDLVVSLGSGLVIVPDFTGLDKDEARELIVSLSLDLGRIISEYDDDVEEGMVIRQSIEAGEEVEPSTSIDLVVSLGPQPVAETPFDLDVWFDNYIIHLELDGVMVDVPIPPWLNHVMYESLHCEDFVFEDAVFGFISVAPNAFYIVNRERDDLMTMIEVSLRNYTGSFDDAAEAEVAHIGNFLAGLDYNHSVTTTIFYQGPGELTAGFSMLEYPADGGEEMVPIFELIKINEYNGILIRTRLRLRTVDAPHMCSDEFAYAFGLWRYINAGYIVMDP